MSAAERARIEAEVLDQLQRHERKELLRFVIVGSVDDGKSTLIGRLLHDLDAVYDDQLAAVKRATTMAGESIDFSLFTDGLAAEREQGITIDVAYRYFATERRKFIVADTPGHVQYTRNMVTGASTADVCVILIDARLGVLEQSRRHAYLASLLGISHLLVAVNKMDLRGYDQAVYDDIRRQLSGFATGLGFASVTFVPICALKGENVAAPAAAMPWYDGPTVLRFLDEVPVGDERSAQPLRYPVQYVLRPHLDYRGFAGQIASGVVRTGDEVLVLPSGRRSRVKAIDGSDGEQAEAWALQSVTLRLTDEVDCSRGDLIVHPDQPPRVERTFDAHVVWLHERALDPARRYLVKHTTRLVWAQVDRVQSKIDLATLTPVATETLALNEIGRLTLTCHQPLYVDAYARNRTTGAFVIVDALTNNTVGAGMILDGAAADGAAADEAVAGDAAAGGVAAGGAAADGDEAAAASSVSPEARALRLGQRGVALLLRGPRSRALAFALERQLFELGYLASVLPAAGTAAARALAARACVEAGLWTLWPGDAADGAALAAALPPAQRLELTLVDAPDGRAPDANEAYGEELTIARAIAELRRRGGV